MATTSWPSLSSEREQSSQLAIPGFITSTLTGVNYRRSTTTSKPQLTWRCGSFNKLPRSSRVVTAMSEAKENMFKAIDAERRGTTSEEVVSQLREMIHKGELRPGDRLPPERDLAKLLGVSRPTLRAGISSLAAVGVLQPRRGAGTFVVEAEGPP